MLYRYENRADNKATMYKPNFKSLRPIYAGKSDTEIYVGKTDGRKDRRLDELTDAQT